MIGFVLGHARRNFRDYHLSVPLLLAGLPGSGRTAGGREADLGIAQGHNKFQVAKIQGRHHDRDVLLEFDYVLRHTNDGGYPSCPWENHHFDGSGCRRSIAAAGRERRILAVQLGPDRRGNVGRASSRRVKRLCHFGRRKRARSLADCVGRSREFYGVIAVGLALGLARNYAGFNAVSMLFWAAVLNGVLAPPLIVLVFLLTSNPEIMGGRSNPRWLALLGWITVVVMAGASCAMFATWK